MPERFVSVREAAEILHLSQSDVRRRVKRGELQAEVLTRPQGTLLRVLVDVPDTDQADATPKADDVSDPRQDVSAVLDLAAALTASLASVAEHSHQRAQEIIKQAGRIAELEREAGKLAGDLAGAERRYNDAVDDARRLAVERDAARAEVERLKQPFWRRWWG